MKRAIKMIAAALLMGLTTTAFAQVEVQYPDAETERQAKEAVGRAQLKEVAVKTLVDASISDDPMLRANAIEGLQLLPDRARPAAQRGLSDPNVGVRFAAVVTAGQLQLDSLVPSIRPLLQDGSPSVRAAALFALHRLGEQVDLTPLAGMLASEDLTLRSNVALILGLLGDKSAVPMLKEAGGNPLRRAGAARVAVVRTQIAEAIVKLGEDSELNTIRAGAYNQFGEVRILSIITMGAVGDRRMLPALEAMAEGQPSGEPDEVRLAAAGSMARLGDESQLAVARSYADHALPVIRSQAAWALGWFKAKEAGETLGLLLVDESPMVRVAAAAAVLQHLQQSNDLR